MQHWIIKDSCLQFIKVLINTILGKRGGGGGSPYDPKFLWYNILVKFICGRESKSGETTTIQTLKSVIAEVSQIFQSQSS